MEWDELLLQEELLRTQVNAVQAREPCLTAFGFGVYEQDQRTAHDVEVEFRGERDEMLTFPCLGEFALCCKWLGRLTHTKTVNRKFTSYGLKHRVEHMCGTYISNGMFIASAVHMGFLVRRAGPTSPNCYLNVSTGSIRSFEAEFERSQVASRP